MRQSRPDSGLGAHAVPQQPWRGAYACRQAHPPLPRRISSWGHEPCFRRRRAPLFASSPPPRATAIARDWYFIAEQPAPAPHLAHPEGCAALRIVLVTVPRVSRSCEHFPDGFDLHLLRAMLQAKEGASRRVFSSASRNRDRHLFPCRPVWGML